MIEPAASGLEESMIERVAKAIDAVSIMGQKMRLSEAYLELMARAAIEAMREPTGE